MVRLSVVAKKARTPQPPRRPVQAPKQRTDQAAADRRKRMILYAVAASGLVGLAVAVGVLAFAGGGSSSSGALEDAGCTVKTVPAQNARHIEKPLKNFKYNTFPPTSGPHYGIQAPFDFYTEPVEQFRIVHNLEHGGVVIMYKGVSDDEVRSLQSLVRQLNQSGFPKVLLEPYPNLTDAKIAVTAWNWILKLQSYDSTSITKFVNAHYGAKGEAPEPNGS